jgi:hypothetical protein
LRLTVGNLRNTRWLSDLGLAIANLRGTTTLHHSCDVDGDALCTSALTVQVVEGTRQTLIPHSGGSTVGGGEGKRTVAADGEASGFTSTSLQRLVKLEPIVVSASRI